MRFGSFLNTTIEEIKSKRYNIWLGISLGNKSFTKELIKDYLEWSLNFTKEDVLVVIGDRLYAINLEVLDGYSKLAALRKALKKGDEKEREIKEILAEIPEDKARLIKVVRFKHVTASKYQDYRTELLFSEKSFFIPSICY